MYYLPKLREIRKARNLTQKELCKKLEMKQSQYSRYESGEDEMKIGTLIEICKALEVSSDYILGLSDVEETKYKIKNNVSNTGTIEKLTMK